MIVNMIVTITYNIATILCNNTLPASFRIKSVVPFSVVVNPNAMVVDVFKNACSQNIGVTATK